MNLGPLASWHLFFFLLTCFLHGTAPYTLGGRHLRSTQCDPVFMMVSLSRLLLSVSHSHLQERVAASDACCPPALGPTLEQAGPITVLLVGASSLVFSRWCSVLCCRKGPEIGLPLGTTSQRVFFFCCSLCPTCLLALVGIENYAPRNKILEANTQ